jgi:hypothetical protein
LSVPASACLKLINWPKGAKSCCAQMQQHECAKAKLTRSDRRLRLEARSTR